MLLLHRYMFPVKFEAFQLRLFLEPSLPVQANGEGCW
jgi:hypothetical protein